MTFTSEQLQAIKKYSSVGVEMARKEVFAEVLKPVPDFNRKMLVSQMEQLIKTEQDVAVVEVIATAYEASYPHFQALALAVTIAASNTASLGSQTGSCAPQDLG